jgi:spore coat polysaccharide biosynthesis protein SpsF
MKKVAIIIARMSSTRLPGKVMLPLNGKPVLQWMIERCRAATLINEVVVATVDQGKSKPIFRLCDELGCPYYAAIDEYDVLDRVYVTAKKFKADIVTEITADCPLVSHYFIDRILTLLEEEDVQYSSNVEIRSFPDGLDVQTYYFSVLEELNRIVTDPIHRSHVGMNIHNFPHAFKTINYLAPIQYFYPDWRLTLDTKEDYELISILYKKFPSIDIPAEEIIDYLKKNKDLLKINTHIKTKKFEEG